MVLDISHITEFVPILVGLLAQSVIQADRKDAGLGERNQLARLADSVMVAVNPEPQVGPDCVAGGNLAGAIATVPRVIEHSQRLVAVGILARGLRRELTK